MSLSRRVFLHQLIPGVSLDGQAVSARGLEALSAVITGSTRSSPLPPGGPSPIALDSNENPIGPGRMVLEAMIQGFDDSMRYPMNAQPSIADLRGVVARKFQVKPENVVIGGGSRDILRGAVRAFSSANRGVVTAAPTYESVEQRAGQLRIPLKRIPVDSAGRLDLEAMAKAAQGAGLVYVCNPNNPTGSVHGSKAIADFIARLRRESPQTAIVIDEAYHDYVTDASYATALPIAMAQPNVFVTRTFSKAYGMAGLRIGFGIGLPKTIEALANHALPYNQNAPGMAAAVAALGDDAQIASERARNTELRGSVVSFFKSAGFSPTDSQANFVFLDIRRPAAEFREACRQQGVLVGREFPPLEKTHIRISIGTAQEMQRALEVFRKVLGVSTAV